MNDSVVKMKSFIEDRNNPYTLKDNKKDMKLKFFVTEQLAAKEVAKSRTMFLDDSRTAFGLYHKQVYVDKTVTLLEKISRITLNPIDYLPSDQKSKFSEKYQRAALKTLLNAQAKGNDTKVILKHDVTTYSYLYD